MLMEWVEKEKTYIYIKGFHFFIGSVAKLCVYIYTYKYFITHPKILELFDWKQIILKLFNFRISYFGIDYSTMYMGLLISLL